MSNITLQDLLEAGTHFGHQTKRWNPKMKRFILCPRNGIYIIDLNKTIENLNKFLSRVQAEVAKGGKVLFVGTKKQIKDCIREEAERCNMPYVTERWLGGMLTNFQTIKASVSRLEKIEAMESDGTLAALPKKEVLNLMKRKEKLIAILAGIRHMRKPPAIIFVVDAMKEHIAIREARRLKIPIGAIIDTNCDPDPINYPIPGNDDAIKSVQLITKAVADAILERGKDISLEEIVEEKAKLEPEVVAEKYAGVVVEEGGELEEAPAATGEAARPKTARRVVRKKIVKTTEED